MNAQTGLRHIFLVRHYEPNVERSGFFNCDEASKFISDYDAADLVKTAFMRPAGLPEKLQKVYCSALPRAKQTARLLYGEETELIENADFNEFQRKIFKLPLFKFPIEVWLAAARFSWVLGLNSRGIETFRQARKRALHCAETLARYAEAETEIVLVAHGFLNAFIRQALKKTWLARGAPRWQRLPRCNAANQATFFAGSEKNSGNYGRPTFRNPNFKGNTTLKVFFEFREKNLFRCSVHL